MPFVPWGIPYHLGENYRIRYGSGGPGIQVPPERIVDTGIYRFIPNAMYLRHMIFMIGLAITSQSWADVALLVFRPFWFNARANEDEVHFGQLFVDANRTYIGRTKRWIPFIY